MLKRKLTTISHVFFPGADLNVLFFLHINHNNNLIAGCFFPFSLVEREIFKLKTYSTKTGSFWKHSSSTAAIIQLIELERTLIRHQSSVHANCLKAWSVVKRGLWGLPCHVGASPSLRACPKAIYHTVIEELATHQKINAELFLQPNTTLTLIG